jgi:hypothetical protein
MASEQSFKNHTRWLPAFHFFAIPVLLINTLNAIRHWYMDPHRHTAFQVLVAAAILTTCFLARIMALTAQDRLIRLEMRLRLAGVLPPDLNARFNELTRSQLVALRFASDAELPDLCRTALNEKTSQRDIKKMIKRWEADHIRV